MFDRYGSRVHPDRLYFTGNDEADKLLAEEPLALLIGFALDQQVSVPVAFSGPLKMKQRLGTLEADAIAGLDPETLEAAFREKPAIHRFPGSMAGRVQELCRTVVSEHAWRSRARVDGGEGRRRPPPANRRPPRFRADEDHRARLGAGEAIRRAAGPRAGP